MTRILESVRFPREAFRDRAEAGDRLAQAVGAKNDPAASVLAVPRGGVAVGEALARMLGTPLEIILVRKLPIPSSPEAGFGAVGIDGSVVLNEEMLPYAGVSPRERDRIVADVLAEVRRRSVAYVGHDRPPDVRGRRVYMVDDGLASGYTMIAAAQMVRRQEPAQLILAVPVSPIGSLRAAEPYFDDVTCLIAQETHPFAVASFYADFHDMSDDEVRETLRRTGSRG